jgi:hypothetical protein
MKATFLILILLVGLVSPLAAQTPAGADSPAALVERLRQAAAEENFGELSACLAPDARREMAMGLWAGTTMMLGMSAAMTEMAAGMGEAVAGEEMTEEAKVAKAELDKKVAGWQSRYDAVMTKHGLPKLSATEDPGDPEALFAKVDLIALTADLGSLLKMLGEEEGATRDSSVPEGQLEGLVINGDSATGKLDGDPVEFVKLDGRWFVKQLPEKDQIPVGN